MKKILIVFSILVMLLTASDSFAQFRGRGGFGRGGGGRYFGGYHGGYSHGYGYYRPSFYGGLSLGFGLYINPFASPYYGYPYYSYPYYSNPYYSYPPQQQEGPPPEQSPGYEYNDSPNSRQQKTYPPQQEGPVRVWVTPHWKKSADGWVWIEGYWRTEKQ